MALSSFAERAVRTAIASKGADQEIVDLLNTSSGISSLTPLTDSSGGAAANSTIGLVTAPTAITDSTTGSTTATFAAGVGVQTLSFRTTLPIGGTGAADLVTNYTPGYKFKILSWSYVEEVAATGTSGSRVYNLEIGTTNTTGGTITVTTASAAVGRVIAGTAITAANTGTAADNISIEVASGGTTHDAGAGTFEVVIQNMDTADAIAGIVTALTAGRTAIVALTDAITELATAHNAILTAAA